MRRHGWMAGMLAGLMLAGMGRAATIYPLPEQTKAATGADFVMVITVDDLTETTADTVQTNSDFAVLAKQGVELVAMVLKTAFYDTATNGNNSLLMTVGDGTDADLYLTSTELNSYGTEVWLKFGRAHDATVVSTVTPATATFMTGVTAQTVTGPWYDSTGAAITNAAGVQLVTVMTNVTSATASAMTNATVASAATTVALGRKVYTADDTVDVFFTPASGYALSALDYGEVWLYFRVWDAR